MPRNLDLFTTSSVVPFIWILRFFYICSFLMPKTIALVLSTLSKSLFDCSQVTRLGISLFSLSCISVSDFPREKIFESSANKIISEFLDAR
jgi:hypothetical protein